jgi:hypothetical protein
MVFDEVDEAEIGKAPQGFHRRSPSMPALNRSASASGSGLSNASYGITDGPKLASPRTSGVRGEIA